MTLSYALALRSTLTPSDSDAQAAVAALRRAIAAGLDDDHLLRTAPRLGPIRSRPDFPTSIPAR